MYVIWEVSFERLKTLHGISCLLCASSATYIATRAEWWLWWWWWWWCRDAAVGSLIRASVNENSLFTKLDIHVRTHMPVCTKDPGAGRRNIRWGIKVYVWVETVGLFLLCFYRVPVALGKSQGRACIPLILHMLLTSRKTTVCVCEREHIYMCVWEPRHVTLKCAGPLQVTWQSKHTAEYMGSDIYCPFSKCACIWGTYVFCVYLLFVYLQFCAGTGGQSSCRFCQVHSSCNFLSFYRLSLVTVALLPDLMLVFAYFSSWQQWCNHILQRW